MYLMATKPATQPISIPDRFEVLRRKAPNELTSIVVSVNEMLDQIDRIFSDMSASGRGAFLVLRGDSGAGKTTFLHTVGLFRQDVKSTSVPPQKSPREFFSSRKDCSPGLEIFILEEREVEIEFSDAELETLLHAINAFIRSPNGQNALVVWPCNTDELRDRVVTLANKLGGDALLGNDKPWLFFPGPSKTQYRMIAERTLATLNEGASFSDLGVTEDQISTAIQASSTIGGFLSRLRKDITENERHVASLFQKEHPRLWIVVISGDEPEKEVAALTRGQHAAVDIERLLSATNANVVQELKKQPEKLGVLGSVLDAKIFHLPVVTALAISRAFADEGLKTRMKERELSLSGISATDTAKRLKDTDLAKLFADGAQGQLTRGPKIGSNTEKAFGKLAEIARSNDVALNKAFGRALVFSKLIDSFKSEQDFGDGLTRRTDLLCETVIGVVRLEMMWRSRTSRAEIANYALVKLQNYGKAIGFLG